MTTEDAKKIYNIVLESLLMAASPDFGLKEERDPEDYLLALSSLLENNSEMDQIQLENLFLFKDEIDDENPIVSSIIQLLGNRLEIRTIE